MKMATKKTTTDTSEEDRLLSINPRKAGHNVKTISVFMDKLDTQINKSYAKLRRNKQKLTSTKKQQTLYDQTMPCPFSANQSSHIHPTLNGSVLQSSFRASAVQENDFALLDNKQVMQYIRLVYDIYNIKDPYNEPQQTDKGFSTNKKIRTFKEKIQKQIGSASTTKNYEVRKSIQLNPFSLSRTHHYKNESAFTAKVEVISLHSKEKQPEIESCRSSTYRFQNKNVLAKKGKISIASHRHNSNAPEHALNTVPQFFRFCFMCQQPILQWNLQSHEQTCDLLKWAFNKTFEQLLVILDQKIGHLVQQINSLLLQKPQLKIVQEFADIKTSVKKWIANIPTTKQQQSNRWLDTDWRGRFNKVQQAISRSVCSSFHLMHKLQWFSKLRENMNNKYTNAG